MTDANKAIDEFKAVLDNIFGTYLDARVGFHLALKQTQEIQQMTVDKFPPLPSADKATNMNYLDSLTWTYGKGPPDASDSIIQHVTTQGEYKARNSEYGNNYKFIGNMALISIYQYWEDCYRGKITKSLKPEREKLTSPIMGDIRWLRNSIIHHHGVALPEIVRCKIFRDYVPGDEIFINGDQLERIIGLISQYLNSLRSPASESHIDTSFV